MALSENVVQKDLDETRRLLYMALFATRTKKYNLAGTLVNALRHHQNIGLDDRNLENIVISLINGDPENVERDDTWAREQIAAITDSLSP